MFVRFRQTAYWLQLSLVETRRNDGKVRHEHIASLGSIALPMSVRNRLVFWQRLHERLARLANRVDAATQGKLLGDIHARIPMVTMDEQRGLQLENAEADERFWTSLQRIEEEQAAAHKGLAAAAGNAAASATEKATEAATKVTAAKERADRVRKGENIEGGLGKPVTREDLEHILGKEHADHCVRVSEVSKAIGFETMVKILRDEGARVERAVIRKLHRLSSVG